MNLYKYSSPAAFYPLAGKMIPWFAIPAAILFAVALYIGFFVAPAMAGDQNEVYHIIFIHVAAAWMGMFLYVLMAIYAAIGWAFNARLASMMASSLSITGALFT
ncbi:MAG: heme ABC transporter permease, partial [Pyrinomonadaceae bacterium]